MLNRALFIGLLASILGLLVLGSRLEEVGSQALRVQPEAAALDPISEVVSEPVAARSPTGLVRTPASLPAAVEVSSRLEIEPVSAEEKAGLSPGNSDEK